MTVLLAELTREQIRARAPSCTAVLPTAAIEQHGPHMPIATDTLACTTIVQRAAEVAGDVLVAPPLHFGASHHHRPYPGVLSLSLTTFIQVVKELCESLALSGFPRVAIVNGHGGNDAAIRVAATDISLSLPQASYAAASYWTIAGPALVADGLVRDLGQLPGHAGAFETSLMLALRSDLVDKPAYPAARAAPPFEPSLAHGPLRTQAGHWLGTGPGYTDDPSRASAEAGNRLLGVIVPAVATWLKELASS